MSMFTDNHKLTLAKTAVADGTAEVLTAVFDMSGWDGIVFKVNHGDVDAAAVMTYTVKENTASSTSSPTPTAIDLSAGTEAIATVNPTLTTGAVVVTESSGNLDNKSVVIDVQGRYITKRYVFLSITCADESHEIVSIEAIQYRNRTGSVAASQGSDVVTLVQAGK